MRLRGRSIHASVVMFAFGLSGCRAEAESADASPRSPAPPVSTESAEHADPALRAALDRGVVLPTSDDATYRVDPFVAVVVFERLRADLDPFVRVDADGPQPAGYRVGELGEDDTVFVRLGLQAGDVVEALNGIPIVDPDSVALALDAAENRLTVSLFRDDLSFTNSYRFDGGLAWRDVIAGDEAPRTAGPDSAAPPDVEADVVPPDASPNTASQARRPARKPSASRPSGSRPSTSTKPASGARSKPSRSAGIQCSSGSACTITKRRFDELRASPSALQSGVTITPAIRNDVFSGYRLKRVSSGSPVHALGFRAGDKITHVNGRDLTDDAQAMALYWSLGSSRVFKVRFERGGRRLVKTIRVV